MSKDVYEVEKILDKRMHNNKAYYYVKWAGFPDSEATWEPINNLKTCKELIREYNKHSFSDVTKSTQITKIIDFTSAKKTKNGIVFTALKRNGETFEVPLDVARNMYPSKLVDFLLQYVK